MGRDLLKRVAIGAFYVVGALAVGYLALYAYVAFTARDLQPGEPIHIFRKPEAPDYSAISNDVFCVAVVRTPAPSP